MVLLVCDRQFNSSVEHLKGYRTSNFQEIFDAFMECDNFGELEVVKINSSNEILYVHQNEMAVVKCNWEGGNDSFLPRYAGTSEMTTCHAVILTSSIGFSIGHLDGSNYEATKEFFEVSVENLRHNANIFDAHIVGGFLDERGFSIKLMSQIMSYLLTSPHKFQLKTLFCYYLNDRLRTESGGKQMHEPIVRAVALDIETGTVKPASIEPSARGPLSVLRNASFYANTLRMNSIFDPVSHVLRFVEFNIPPSDMVHYARRSRRTNAELANCSTTPKQETNHFYDMLRRTGDLLAHMLVEKRNFFENGNLEFSYDANLKCWIPLNPQTEEALRHPLTSF
nr:protein N terminal asparagine amidohydrolase [Hymenolepis microstoma]